jgi:predicted RNase H-like nuclease (RuvC/YqgF family)
MALYHPHDNLEDNGVEEPINPDPINDDRIKELTDEIEELKLKNIELTDEIEELKLKNKELEKNVIVDVTKLRYMKSIIKNNSDEVVKKKSGDDDDDDDDE